MKKILAFGVFDIIHPGHLHYLKEAKKLGDHLTVIIARDSSVKKIKGRFPRKPENVRLQIISALKNVDQAILGHKLQNQEEKANILSKLNPDVIVLGYDQHFSSETYKVVRINKLADYSSSNYL